ncbi:histidine kinase [Epilithonimonas sp.]|uniref:sensor histidine kinase n=1 Tax=Epilithonimonas sp. TaxID=2894511 RepID=UPI0028A0A0AB|nr:histidine kinase [Epilithonimonas sp.]
MKYIPEEVKVTYIISIFVMMLFVGFLIFLVFIYNKRQLLFHQQQRLKESEYQNHILQKELEKQKEIERERERISSDMHDDIGARISALKLQSEFIKENSANNPFLTSELDELIKTTEEMTVAMREMIWSLKTQNDFLLSFISFSHKYATDFFSRSKIKIHFVTMIQKDYPLYTEIRRNLFFCYKEALNNIYKHSQATHVEIVFMIEKDSLKLTISDNGLGIQEKPDQVGNYGMYNMQNRMRDISGTLQFPVTEKGTLLIFTSPLRL